MFDHSGFLFQALRRKPILSTVDIASGCVTLPFDALSLGFILEFMSTRYFLNSLTMFGILCREGVPWPPTAPRQATPGSCRLDEAVAIEGHHLPVSSIVTRWCSGTWRRPPRPSRSSCSATDQLFLVFVFQKKIV